MDRLSSHEDANLICRLYEMRREETMRQARAWFVASFFPKSAAEDHELCPVGSQENAWARMVTSYWEMVASFVTSGVLNEELFFQSGQELLLTWVRVKPFVQELRTVSHPNAWRNLEMAGERFIQYWESTTPGAFEKFAARMSTPGAQAAAHKAE